MTSSTEPVPRKPGRRWVAAALVLLLSQGLFWSLLSLGEYAVFPAGAHYEASVHMQRLDEHRVALDATPLAVPIHPAPVYRYRDASGAPRARFVHHFRYQADGQNWALYLSWSRRVSEVRLNGETITARAPLDIWSVLGGFDPVLYDLPLELLRDGQNQLEFEVFGVANKVLPVFFVGELEPLFSAYAWAQLISVDFVVAAIGVMLFVALLCVITPWAAGDRRRVGGLVALLLLWSLRNLSFFGFDGSIPPPWRQVAHYQLTFMFLFALAWFAARWTATDASHGRLYAAGALLSVLIALGAGLYGDNALVFRLLFPIESWLTFGLVSLALLQFGRYAADGGWPQRYEALLFMLCLTAVGVDALDDRYDISLPLLPQWPLTFYAAPVCGLLLALGSCTILVSQSQRARALLESLNQVLDRRLAAQADALNQAHIREQAATRERAVLAERQRLMRDMHDGLGGQLVSLLMRFRSGHVAPDQAEVEIARALDDLRLIVTSLDHADENIGIALGNFRERVEPRLRDAGLALRWHIDPVAGSSHLPVEHTLNLLRILQEASTNVLKHAQASVLSVSLDVERNGAIRLRISDNGAGINPEAPLGKGISNMRQRARRMGSELQIVPLAPGTSLSLVLSEVAERVS